MTEILNLSTLCRCCHIDGSFKSLEAPYMYDGTVEVYLEIFEETFGVKIFPPLLEASFMICDDCIFRLRQSKSFKEQVLRCEQKFHEYCENELALKVPKDELEDPEDSNTNDHDQEYPFSYKDDDDDDNKASDEAAVDVKNEDSQPPEIKIELDQLPPANENVKKQTAKKIVKKPPTNKNRKRQTTNKNAKTQTAIKNQKNQTANKIFEKHTDNENLEKEQRNQKLQQTNNSKSISDNKNENGKQIGRRKYKCDKLKRNPVFKICAVCDERFDKGPDLTDHITSCHPAKIECQKCSVEFETYKSYSEHLKICGKIYKCNYCDKTFRSVYVLNYHEKFHNRQAEIFVCDYCNKEFAIKCVLRKHIYHIHLGIRPWVCEYCGHAFTDATGLRNHTVAIHMDKAYKIKLKHPCSNCGKKLASKKYLRLHWQICTRKKANLIIFPCTICARKFTNNFFLKRHIYNDHGSNEFQCGRCYEQFENENDYSLHLITKHQTENTEKPLTAFICEICGKHFSGRFPLKRHMDAHNGKFYGADCDICGMTFSQKHSMLRHVQFVHNIDKPVPNKVKCPTCKIYVKNLEAHQTIHTNRPYKCEYCSKTYPMQNTLNRHIKHNHLGIREHKCHLCPKEYYKRNLLVRHLRVKHDITTYKTSKTKRLIKAVPNTAEADKVSTE